MLSRCLSSIFFSACILTISGHTYAEGQAEYAKNSYESWKIQDEVMNKGYSRLLAQVEAEPNKEPAQKLITSKEKWEEFRSLFCKSVSQTYGGAWASVHESECRVKLANQLNETMSGYGW